MKDEEEPMVLPPPRRRVLDVIRRLEALLGIEGKA